MTAKLAASMNQTRRQKAPAGTPVDTRVAAVMMRLSGGTADLDPRSCGRALHASFLKLLGTLDAPLAERLHSGGGVRSFTVSLVPHSHAGKETGSSFSGDCFLRATSLDHSLSRSLLETDAWSGKNVHIRSADLLVTGVLATPSESWLSGSHTFGELTNNGIATARDERSALLVKLRFLTATSFRLADSRLMMPLPVPRLVFQSLEQKWNAAASNGIWIDWPEFERCVSVARYHTRTEIFDMGRYRQVGFVGDVDYIIDRHVSRETLEAIHILAGFARYAGVGAKTTMGMGLVTSLDRQQAMERDGDGNHRAGDAR